MSNPWAEWDGDLIGLEQVRFCVYPSGVSAENVPPEAMLTPEGVEYILRVFGERLSESDILHALRWLRTPEGVLQPYPPPGIWYADLEEG